MKTFGLLFLFLLFAALHEGSAAEQFLRKEHPQGKEEIDVKNRLRYVPCVAFFALDYTVLLVASPHTWLTWRI